MIPLFCTAHILLCITLRQKLKVCQVWFIDFFDHSCNPFTVDDLLQGLSKRKSARLVHVVDHFRTRPSSFAENNHLKPEFSLVVVLQRNELGDPPFYWCYLLVIGTRKTYFKENKSWFVEVVVFVYK